MARSARLDGVFAALADSTRRAMVARLARGPCTVSELARPFAMSLPAVSKHLKVLEKAGLVRRHVDGRIHRCRLEVKPMNDASEWIEHYRVFWQRQFASLEQHLQRRRAAGARRSKRKTRKE